MIKMAAESDVVKWYEKGVFRIYEFSESDKLSATKDTKLSGRCRLCKTILVTISGRRSVSSNFWKHARVSSITSIMLST